jgi:uncharacterized protein YaaW (UPF0174 family)
MNNAAYGVTLPCAVNLLILRLEVNECIDRLIWYK